MLGAGSQFGAGVFEGGDLTLVGVAKLFPLAGGVFPDQPGLAFRNRTDPVKLTGRRVGRLAGAHRILVGCAGTGLCFGGLLAGLSDRGVPVLLGGYHPCGGSLPGLNNPGLSAIMSGLGRLVSGGLRRQCGGQLSVGFGSGGERFLGGGCGLLPQLPGAGSIGVSASDLLRCLGLDRLDLRGRRLRISRRVELADQVSEPTGQHGDIRPDRRPQLCRPRGRHRHGPVQVRWLNRAGSLAGKLLSAPERGQRGVRLVRHRIRLAAVLRLGTGAVLDRSRLPVA